jgi:hypothetical protein
MDESRFDRLRIKLLSKGIAARHARRACQELKGHYLALVDDAVERGESPESARAAADQVLGSDAAIIERFTALPELQAMPCRWPNLTFTLLPIVSVIVLIASAGASVIWSLPVLTGHTTHVPALLDATNAFMKWGVPVVVATPFALAAHRHRMPLRWPIRAIMLASTLAAVVQFSVNMTAPGTELPYEFSVGIGFSGSFPNEQLIRAVVASLVVGIPLVIASRRRRLSVTGEGQPAIDGQPS